jgi:hypothetical protein
MVRSLLVGAAVLSPSRHVGVVASETSGPESRVYLQELLYSQQNLTGPPQELVLSLN